MRFRYSRHGRQRALRGQAIVEFVFVSPVFFTLFVGFLNMSQYGLVVARTNFMAREGVRYASLNPTTWSSSASPASNTIQGEIELASSGHPVPNTDAHIVISYYTYNPATGTTTECGYYSQTSSAFVTMGSLSESGCVAPGDFVAISVNEPFTPVIPGFTMNVGTTQQVWMVIS